MIRQKGFRGRFHNLKWRLHASSALFSLTFTSLHSDLILFGPPLPSRLYTLESMCLDQLSLRAPLPSNYSTFGTFALRTLLPSNSSPFRTPLPSEASPFGPLSLRTPLTSDSYPFGLPFPHTNPFQVPILKSALTIFCKQSLKQNYTRIFRYTSTVYVLACWLYILSWSKNQQHMYTVQYACPHTLRVCKNVKNGAPILQHPVEYL